MKFKQFTRAGPDPPWAPTALTVSLFLTDVSHRGPTAAAGALSDMVWISTHLGINLHTDDPAIKRVATIPPTHEEKSALSFTVKIVVHCSQIGQ